MALCIGWLICAMSTSVLLALAPNLLEQCSEQDQCVVEDDIAMPGNDLPGMVGGIVDVSSAGECCSICVQTAGCLFWTYRPSESKCWVKISDAGRRVDNEAISGSLTGCSYSVQPGTFLYHLACNSPRFSTLDDAKTACCDCDECSGVTCSSDGACEMRIGGSNGLFSSHDGETTHILEPCGPMIYIDAFGKTVKRDLGKCADDITLYCPNKITPSSVTCSGTGSGCNNLIDGNLDSQLSYEHQEAPHVLEFTLPEKSTINTVCYNTGWWTKVPNSVEISVLSEIPETATNPWVTFFKFNGKTPPVGDAQNLQWQCHQAGFGSDCLVDAVQYVRFTVHSTFEPTQLRLFQVVFCGVAIDSIFVKFPDQYCDYYWHGTADSLGQCQELCFADGDSCGGAMWSDYHVTDNCKKVEPTEDIGKCRGTANGDWDAYRLASADSHSSNEDPFGHDEEQSDCIPPPWDVVYINFQPSSSLVPTYYWPDYGGMYTTHNTEFNKKTAQFGWSCDLTEDSQDRENVELITSTFMILDRWGICENTPSWEFKTGNGDFQVSIIYGDVNILDTTACMIEGKSASVGSVPSRISKIWSGLINVGDGVLTFSGRYKAGCDEISAISISKVVARHCAYRFDSNGSRTSGCSNNDINHARFVVSVPEICTSPSDCVNAPSDQVCFQCSDGPLGHDDTPCRKRSCLNLKNNNALCVDHHTESLSFPACDYPGMYELQVAKYCAYPVSSFSKSNKCSDRYDDNSFVVAVNELCEISKTCTNAPDEVCVQCSDSYPWSYQCMSHSCYNITNDGAQCVGRYNVFQWSTSCLTHPEEYELQYMSTDETVDHSQEKGNYGTAVIIVVASGTVLVLALIGWCFYKKKYQKQKPFNTDFYDELFSTTNSELSFIQRKFYCLEGLRRIALVIGNGNAGKTQDVCHNDARAMEYALQQLDFEVTRVNDLTSSEMIEQVGIHSHAVDVGCFLFYFSGHGSKDSIVSHDRKLLRKEDLLQFFHPKNSNTLHFKPKIFLWDCCRGDLKERTHEEGMEYKAELPIMKDVPSDPAITVMIPSKFVDFLFGYATVDSYKAYCPTDTNNKSLWTFFLEKNLLKYGRRLEFTQILVNTQAEMQEYVSQKPGWRQTSNHENFLGAFLKF